MEGEIEKGGGGERCRMTSDVNAVTVLTHVLQ